MIIVLFGILGIYVVSAEDKSKDSEHCLHTMVSTGSVSNLLKRVEKKISTNFETIKRIMIP